MKRFLIFLSSQKRWPRLGLTLVFIFLVHAAPAAQTCVPQEKFAAPVIPQGSRWTESVYQTWAKFIDSDLGPRKICTGGGNCEVQTFESPFVGCSTVTVGVARPFTEPAPTQSPKNGLPVSKIVLSCPTTPQSDSTVTVQNALNTLFANQQSALRILKKEGATAPVYPVTLELAPSCDYYFIAWNASNIPTNGVVGHIDVPAITDFTFEGSGSTLHFITPVAVLGMGAGGGSPYFSQPPPNQNSQTNQILIPQDGFNVAQGGERIRFQNFNAQTNQTILTVNGAPAAPITASNQNGIDWNHSVPVVDFGIIYANKDGSQTILLNANQNDGTTYYNPALRDIVETSPSAPQDPLTLVPSQEAFPSSGKVPYYSTASGSQVVINSTDLVKILIPQGQANAPMKVFHAVFQNGSTFRLNDGTRVNAAGDTILVPLDDVSIYSVNVYSSISGVVGGHMSSGLLINGLNIKPKSEQDPHMVAPANNSAVEVSSDLIVENSKYYYGGDDNIDSHVSMLPLASITLSGGIYSISLTKNSLPVAQGSTFCFASQNFEPIACAKLSTNFSGSGPMQFANSDVISGSLANIQVNADPDLTDLTFNLSRPFNRAITATTLFLETALAEFFLPPAINSSPKIISCPSREWVF